MENLIIVISSTTFNDENENKTGSGNNKVIYIAQLKDETNNVDVQFYRRILAYVLKCPKRTYWAKYHQPKVKEIKDCENLKFFFKQRL
ncbi:unnamed protein product [Rotaria sp. Silwood1]|nr:unnamed protein product [Rotaria sp. Silwood1]